LSRQAIGWIESGKNTDLETIADIAATLGVDVSMLLGEMRARFASREARLDEVRGDGVETFGDTPERLIEQLLTQPRTYWTNLVSDSRYHTVAVARHLADRASDVRRTDPMLSLDFARAATLIVERLADSGTVTDVVSTARAAAWRELGYTLYYVGDIPEALAAVDHAERSLSAVACPEYEHARTGIARSVIYTALDRHDEAIDCARQSAIIFRSLGNAARLAVALEAEAFALIKAYRFRDALPILLERKNNYAMYGDESDHAGVVGNIALCYRETGRLVDALQAYRTMERTYTDMGNQPEAARARLNIATLLGSQGQLGDAEALFRSVRDELLALGMRGLVVDSDLLLAELLLATNAYDEVVALCTACIDYFNRSGLAATGDGLTALSYLKEAAAHRKATPDSARYVRRYFSRLSSQPALLFAPPPDRPR
jgi:tetratricopeptide (TPR) repeat protein